MDGFGKRIATLRKDKWLTQLALANALGVSDKAVSKWEKGGGYPEMSLLVRIAELFSVSTDYLLLGKAPEKEVLLMSCAEYCVKNDDVDMLKTAIRLSKDKNFREEKGAEFSELLSVLQYYDTEVGEGIPIVKEYSLSHWLEHFDEKGNCFYDYLLIYHAPKIADFYFNHDEYFNDNTLYGRFKLVRDFGEIRFKAAFFYNKRDYIAENYFSWHEEPTELGIKVTVKKRDFKRPTDIAEFIASHFDKIEPQTLLCYFGYDYKSCPIGEWSSRFPKGRTKGYNVSVRDVASAALASGRFDVIEYLFEFQKEFNAKRYYEEVIYIKNYRLEWTEVNENMMDRYFYNGRPRNNSDEFKTVPSYITVRDVIKPQRLLEAGATELYEKLCGGQA